MISIRTLGTSEKNVRATIPATTPNDAAVAPLLIKHLLSIETNVSSPLRAMEAGIALREKHPRKPS